jgi:hypothetical protein
MMTNARALEVHSCFVEGCTKVAPYGWAPNRETPYKWACADHRKDLTRSAPAKPLPQPAPSPAGDLFGKKG